MSRFIVLAALLFGLSVQLQAVAATDLIGTWTIEWDETWAFMKNSPRLAALSPEQIAAAEKMMASQVGSMTFAFSADKLAINMGSVKKEGAYKVLSTEGDVMSLELTDPDNGKAGKGSAEMKDGKLQLTVEEATFVLKKAAAKDEKKEPAKDAK